MSMRPLVVLDGAHNPSAARALGDELRRALPKRRLRLVFGAMRDKDWREMWTALRPLVTDAIVTQPRTPRSAAAHVIARAIGEDVPVRVIPDPEAAAVAVLEASAPDDAVLVTGSLFLVGDVYPFFRRAGGSGAGFHAGTPMLPMVDHFAHETGNAGAATAEAGHAGRGASRSGRGGHRRRAAGPGVVGPPRAQ
jgi:hypothetical protein